MPRFLKLLLGAATALLFALSGYLFLRLFGLVIDVVDRGGSVPSDWLREPALELGRVVFVGVLLLVVLFAAYLWHLLVHRAGRTAAGWHDALWVGAFLVLPMFAMPIYWLTHVWPEQSAEPNHPLHRLTERRGERRAASPSRLARRR